MFSCKRSLAFALVFSLLWLGALSPSAGASSSVSTSHASPIPHDQDAQALADYVAQFLKTRAQVANRSALHIHVAPPKTKGVATCNTLQAVNPKHLRSHTSVHVRCLAPQTWTLYVQTHLTLPGVYYAAARTLAPGETIGSNDLRAVPADLLPLPADIVTDTAQIIGRIATQRVRKGSAIKSGVLRDAQSIQRGQRVHTEARGPGFVMRGVGQALQSGAPGSAIQVRTVAGAVVSGRVLDATTVQVPL